MNRSILTQPKTCVELSLIRKKWQHALAHSSLLIVSQIKITKQTKQIQWISKWSSQFYTQLKQLRKESLKKNSGLNGIRTHDLCDTGAVLHQLSYQANWELVIVWIRYIPVEVMRWKWIYENSYIWTAEERMNK